MFKVNSNSVRSRMFRANDDAYLDKNQTADDAKNVHKKPCRRSTNDTQKMNKYFIARSN